jgi:hypothetical protein
MREIARFARVKARFFHLPATKPLLATTSRLKNYAEVEKAVEDAARSAALRNL